MNKYIRKYKKLMKWLDKQFSYGLCKRDIMLRYGVYYEIEDSVYHCVVRARPAQAFRFHQVDRARKMLGDKYVCLRFYEQSKMEVGHYDNRS